MVQESIAILLVGVLLLTVFLRSKHYGYALGSAPIFIIPFSHLVIRGVLALSKGRFFGLRPAVVTAFVNVLALALTCVCIVLIAQGIQSKRNKRLYLGILIGYSVLLGWVYVFTSLKPILG